MKFEGEYLDEKIWNGKGYSKNGNIKHEIKNGNGHIIEYSLDYKLKFEGEYYKGYKSGKGKEYFYNNYCKILMFKGEYKNGLKWDGKIYDSNNNNQIYEIKDGKGYLKEYNYNGELEFEGEY